MKVKGMDILQHNLGKSKQKSFLTYPKKLKFDPRPTTEREISESRKQSFLSGVRTTLPKATISISFSLPQCEVIPPSLEDIAQEINSCSDNSNVNNLFKSTNISLLFRSFINVKLLKRRETFVLFNKLFF